jgi:thiamine biosynthesis lipoprotein
MGTDAMVVVRGGSPMLPDLAAARLADLEARWSRFIPTSDISRLNAAAGEFVRVSSETIELVSLAIEGWWLTDGLFDPTVLGDVQRAGYVRSFEKGPDLRGADNALGHGCDAIAVDSVGQAIRLPPGVGFDPGGVGKGLAADMVAADLLAAGAEGACVDLGGDVRVAGRGPGPGGTWAIAIDHPFRPEPAAVVVLEDGAVATSSRLRRSWLGPEGEMVHHLIDPRRGTPARTGVATATVVAARAWQAEVLTKAVFLEGMEAVDRLGAAGLLVLDGGGVVQSAGMAHYTAVGVA